MRILGNQNLKKLRLSIWDEESFLRFWSFVILGNDGILKRIKKKL